MGRSIAVRLAAEGAHVACGVRKEADASSVLQEIQMSGGHAFAIALDVTDPASVATAVERASRPDRRIDILVNNAGIGGLTPLDGEASSDETWHDIMEVNLTGVWRTCRAVFPFLPDAARIINISSVVGRFGVAGQSAYSASKHAIIGLTRSLALELAGRRITVNAVCPGWVDTDLARSGIRRIASESGISESEAFSLAGNMAPLGQVLTPSEIAGLVAYLASDEARNLTGQAIVLDGGQVMP
jgi:ketoreductase